MGGSLISDDPIVMFSASFLILTYVVVTMQRSTLRVNSGLLYILGIIVSQYSGLVLLRVIATHDSKIAELISREIRFLRKEAAGLRKYSYKVLTANAEMFKEIYLRKSAQSSLKIRCHRLLFVLRYHFWVYA